MIRIRLRTSSVLAPVLRSEPSPTACGSAGTQLQGVVPLLRDAGVRQVRLDDDRHAATTLLLTAAIDAFLPRCDNDVLDRLAAEQRLNAAHRRLRTRARERAIA